MKPPMPLHCFVLPPDDNKRNRELKEIEEPLVTGMKSSRVILGEDTIKGLGYRNEALSKRAFNSLRDKEGKWKALWRYKHLKMERDDDRIVMCYLLGAELWQRFCAAGGDKEAAEE